MASATYDAELDFYKRQPIGELLLKLGWTAKNQLPYPTKHGDVNAENFSYNGMKVQCYFASLGGSNHFMWICHNKSVTTKSGHDKGTIIDIACAMESGNFARAKQLLRSVTGYSPSTTSHSHSHSPSPKTSPSSHPLDKISTPSGKSSKELSDEYDFSGKIWSLRDAVPDYLLSRGIDALHPVFHESFRISSGYHRNIVFPYRRFDDDGKFEIAGCEEKNVGWKSYSEGGHAGVWLASLDNPTVAVINESPIDSMSYARLMTDYDNLSVCFLAVRSGGEQTAVDMLCGLYQRGLRYVIVATDNDAAGMQYASKIMAGMHKQCPDLIVRYEAPLHAQVDWNDSLQEDVRLRSGRGDQRRHDSVRPDFGGR